MNDHRHHRLVIFLAAFVLLLSACADRAAGRDKTNILTLFAFNYTDRAILDITVDGMWLGGASAYTNGKSAMGPRAPRDRSRPHSVDVTWSISASYYDLGSNKYIDDGELVSRQVSVPLKLPYPDDPNMLLLHFYPDGRIEAELIARQDDKFDFRRIPIPEGHKYHGTRR